tara:strand:- start:87 stop:1310 length:1224 start_codon:yes stop_codon:yes gene_type:complete
MSVDMPTFTTEIRFSAGASSTGFELGTAILGYSTLGTAVTWSNVSSDVRNISIARGKQRELDEFSAGSASVTLSNTARTYDPNYAAGAYYGQVKPGRWIRIKATYDSTDYELYQGVIREWEYGYSFPNEATAIPRASDFIEDLNGTDITTTTSAAASGTVVAEILNAANIIPRDLDTGAETFQAVSLASANALTALQTADKSEGGGLSAVYCNEQNQVVFEDRNSLSTNTRSNTSQATFGTVSLPVDEVDLDYSSDLIKNDVNLTRIGGSVQTKTDADSQSDYGIRSFSLTGLYNNSDANVANIAQSYIDSFKDAELRVRSITIHPRLNAALMVQALTRKIRDRITISYNPPPGTATVTDEMFISGIEHIIMPQDFRTKFTLESVTGRSPYWMLGTGELGTTTVLGF